jgi:DnaJ homolog subfamily C member 19
MPYFLLFLAVLVFAAMWLMSKKDRAMHQGKDYTPKEWLAAGGVLGAAIFLARLSRIPFATVLTALPFILPYLKSAEGAQEGAGMPPMNRREAALILGVSTHASKDEILEAHRKLIVKNHPDAGGSDYLAAKINQARDILLK